MEPSDRVDAEFPFSSNPETAPSLPAQISTADVSDEQRLRQQIAVFQKYIDECITEPAASETVIGLVSGHLMKLSCLLSVRAESSVEKSLLDEQRIDGVMRIIDVILRLTRQVDRFERTRLELAKVRGTLEVRGGAKRTTNLRLQAEKNDLDT
jgi:hypothetical protein